MAVARVVYRWNYSAGYQNIHFSVARIPPQTRCSKLHYVPWYICNSLPEKNASESIEIERVQTGVRLEKRMLKVLKALAELKEMSLGDLLEGIVLHAFEGKAPFSPETMKQIEQFKTLYGMSLRATESHKMKEKRR